MVSFDVAPYEARLIKDIADRAVQMSLRTGGKKIHLDMFQMDVTATHANGCPLKLSELLSADDFNFSHDVFGIYQHLDRKTGKLTDCFVPRFAHGQVEVG